jgi:RNA polymerase sigma-70 factor (ECF subfamily)
MNCFEHFNQYRSLLFSIAYRMLGSAIDAEDMVQEAFLRCQQASATTIQSPKTYLSTIVTRLCIDHLRSARIRREQYVGPWLPEPLIAEQSPNPMVHAELAESLSFAFLTLLECLSPTERAIFLLREVFDYDYADIAKIVHKSIPNCRQIVRRARQHLILRRPTISVPLKQKEELVEQFLANWNQGNVRNLVALMAEDITFWSDGGGQVVAARKPLHGHLKVARFLVAIRQSKRLPRLKPQFVQINSQPGIANYVDNHIHSTFSFEFVDGHIQSIFAVVNPEKLKASKYLM